MGLKANSPFDHLLEKYGLNRRSLIKKMAQDDLRGCEKAPSYLANLEYRKEVRKKDISRYARKLREPGMTMFYYLQKLIGCTNEELVMTLKQNTQLDFIRQTIERERREKERKVVFEQKMSDCLFFLKVREMVFFCLIDGDAIEQNFYKIQCLRDGLKNIKGLDSYPHPQKLLQRNNSGSGFSVQEEKVGEYTRINVTFEKPLKSGENVTIITDVKIPDTGSNFCIQHPTKLLIFNYVQTDPSLKKYIKLLKPQDGSNSGSSEATKEAQDYDLIESRMVIENPEVESCYRIEWI